LIANRSATASIANGLTVSSPNASQDVVIRNVTGIYNTVPTGAHVNFGTATGGFSIENCTSTQGTLYGGSVPTNFAANRPLAQVSGAVSDAAFSTAPLDGTLGLDTLNKRFYIRENGGTWSFIPIKTVTAAVISTTTVTGVTAETVLQGATIPANDPQTASVYQIVGYGVLTAASGDLGWTVRWGGTTGKVLAALPSTNAAPVITNGSFKYTVTVTFRSTSVVTAAMELLIDSSTTTNAAVPYIQTPTSATTVSTTSDTALVVDITPSASGDTVTLLGGYVEKVR